MKRLKKRIVLLVVCCLLGSAAWAAPLIYVNAAASGANNGSSWTDAFTDLQSALDIANAGDVIWVAAGTYLPSKDVNGVPTGGTRASTFLFDADISIYGGFLGFETALSQRTCSPATPTVLSGDLGVVGDPSDNALHVCHGIGLTPIFLMDCITIDGGNAVTTPTTEDGAGWYNNAIAATCSPTFQQVIFQNNEGARGGAFYNNATNGGIGEPKFTDCKFQSNVAQLGGGIYNDADQSGKASPTMNNCTFFGNLADEGGAIYNYGSMGEANGILTTCVFNQNKAQHGGAMFQMADDGTTRGFVTDCSFMQNNGTIGGGALYFTAVNGDGKTTYTNCTFDRNKALQKGGAVLNVSAGPQFMSCLFVKNQSLVEGGAFYNDGPMGTIANPRVTSCEFRENTATLKGGAIYNQATFGDASPFVVLSKFIANTSSAGGALINSCIGNSSGGVINSTYYNCIFSRNSAVGKGGVIYAECNGGTCRSHFASTSFAGNTASDGVLFNLTQNTGGITAVTTYNMASYGHTGLVATVAGGATIQAYGGMYETSISAVCNGTCYPGINPLFNNAAADDLTLQAASPAANVGLNAWYLPIFPLDLAGNTRQQGGIIDLGAYETPIIPCPSIIYVNRIATGANNGTSWADAYRDLQSALAEARINPCTEKILIAKGTYKPTTVNDRNANFELVNDIEIYGGFPNTGNPWFPDRDLVAHETILSGDIGVVGNPNDNSFIVVSGKGTLLGGAVTFNLNAGTLLHGVSITQGLRGLEFHGNSNTVCRVQIDSCSFYNSGRGIQIMAASNGMVGATNVTLSPEFRNCKIFNHNGSAAALVVETYTTGSITNPYFYKCDFFNNSSTAATGAAWLRGQITPLFQSCIFRNNSSTVNSSIAGGGAVFLESAGWPPTGPMTVCQPDFVNCLFHHNTATRGGAVYSWSSGPNGPTSSRVDADFINCTFADNTSPNGSTIHSYCARGRTDIRMQNCITWGNGTSPTGAVVHMSEIAPVQNRVTFTNSLIESPSCGTNTRLYIMPLGASTIVCGPGNIFNLNPLFQNAGAADYRLSSGSPGFNTGNNGFVPSGITEDIAGNDRIHAGTGGIVDMGCYENYPGMALRPAANISTTTAVVYPGFGPTSATLTSSIIGGTAPYTYAWSNGATTADITVSPSQTTAYTLTVTDANGLSLLAARTITVKSILCVRPNGQIGVTICNSSGQTLCVSPLVATIMVAAGNATLGGCLEPNKTEQDSQDEQDLHDIAVAAGISIYPNPVVDVLHLQLDDFTYRRGVIIDPLGKVIQQWEGSLSTIHLPPLAAGIYYIRLEADGGTVSQRFVKQ